MTMCPFMSVDMSVIDISDPKKPNGKAVPCVPSCALHFKGHCSINVIAQTMHKKYMDDHNATQKAAADDCQQ